MRFSVSRALTIARREYVTTVRRKAFVFTLLLPVLILLTVVMMMKWASEDVSRRALQTRILAVVDSSGLFADAPLRFRYEPPTVAPDDVDAEFSRPAALPKTVDVLLRRFEDQAVALDSLDRGSVRQVLVIAPDFRTSGRLRLYENDTRVMSRGSEQRPLQHWLAHHLLARSGDSMRVERTLWLDRGMDLYTKDRLGRWSIKDGRKQLTGFLLPYGFGFLLAMAIVAGGQYLLQGIAEEKETRILESLMCMVSSEEFLFGKLVGLGCAGLTFVGVWVASGVIASSNALAFLRLDLPPTLILLAIGLFLFGYLFYASLMMGIGALAGNTREANQTSSYLTMLNFVPMMAFMLILNAPNSPIALGLSFFPPTTATTMVIRLSAANSSGAVIPSWQVAAAFGTLALASVLGLLAGAKLFRIGMLLYGKSPNLPEILRILRQK